MRGSEGEGGSFGWQGGGALSGRAIMLPLPGHAKRWVPIPQRPLAALVRESGPCIPLAAAAGTGFESGLQSSADWGYIVITNVYEPAAGELGTHWELLAGLHVRSVIMFQPSRKHPYCIYNYVEHSK